MRWAELGVLRSCMVGRTSARSWKSSTHVFSSSLFSGMLVALQAKSSELDVPNMGSDVSLMTSPCPRQSGGPSTPPHRVGTSGINLSGAYS